MAQLSDDCFAFGGPMMSVDEAVGIIAARVTPVREAETVALAQADGRILATDISAPLPLPPFTNSAVDGYAVRNRGTRCGFSPARRCPMAPTRCSCRRMCESMAMVGSFFRRA